MKYRMNKKGRILKVYRVVSMGLRGIIINKIEDEIFQWGCRWIFEDEDLAMKTLLAIPGFNEISDEAKEEIEQYALQLRESTLLKMWAKFDLSDIEEE